MGESQPLGQAHAVIPDIQLGPLVVALAGQAACHTSMISERWATALSPV